MTLLRKLPESRHFLHVRLTVTLHRKTSTTGYAAGLSVGDVWREDVEIGQVTAGGTLLTDKHGYFNLYRTALTAATFTQDPKPGDVIETESARYTVDEVEHLERDEGGIQRYRCLGTRE